MKIMHSLSPAAGLLVVGMSLFGSGALHAADPIPRGGAGSRPVAILLCKYADKPNTYGYTSDKVLKETWLPNPVTFVQDNVTADNSISGLVRDASLGTVDFKDSQAFGWYNLPNPMSRYTNSQIIGNDCIAAAQNNGVNLNPFAYVAVYVNDELPDASGVAYAAQLPGRSPTATNAIVLGVLGLTSAPLVLHEMGHVLINGGRHTNSSFDPLGSAQLGGDLRAGRQEIASVGPEWDAAQRQAMGFIPADAQVTHADGTQTYNLSRLTQPFRNGSLNLLPTAINVPLPNFDGKFVISARTKIGYDGYPKFTNVPYPFVNIPAEGVLIELDPSGGDVELQMSKPGGDRRSTDAVWLPGQTFTAALGIFNKVSIKVESFNPTGNPTATVTVTKQPVYPVPPGSWQLRPGLLVQISVASDDTVMGVSGNNQIWQWNAIPFVAPGTGWDLVTGTASLVTVVNRTKAFIWDGTVLSVGNRNGWTPLANVPSTITGVTWLSAARDGTLYVVDTNGNVNRLDATTNTWSVVGSNARRVAAQDASTFYLVQRDSHPSGGTVQRVSGGTTTELGGRVTDISVDERGDLWGVSGGAGPFHWNGSGWDPIAGPTMVPDPSLGLPPGRLQQPGILSQISVGGLGTLWGLNVDEAVRVGTIYQWR